MSLFKSNAFWAAVVIGLSVLLYIQALQSHIKDQSIVIDSNRTVISDLNKDVVRMELELELATEIAELVADQKEELEKATIEIEQIKIQQKKKVTVMSPEQRSNGEEINTAWDFYEFVISNSSPPLAQSI